MAYSTANRPYLVVGAIAGGAGQPTLVSGVAGSSDVGGNIWAYRSSDSVGTVMASNYFTDGLKLGLRKGDMVFITQFSTAMAVSNMGIGVISAVSTAGATAGILGTSSTA